MRQSTRWGLGFEFCAVHKKNPVAWECDGGPPIKTHFPGNSLEPCTWNPLHSISSIICSSCVVTDPPSQTYCEETLSFGSGFCEADSYQSIKSIRASLFIKTASFTIYSLKWGPVFIKSLDGKSNTNLRAGLSTEGFTNQYAGQSTRNFYNI